MTCKIISGTAIAKQLQEEIALKVIEFKNATGTTPCLGVILANDNPASQIYVNHKCKACNKVGIKSVVEKLEHPSWDDLIEHVHKMNNDDTIHGVLVQLPLAKELQKNTTVLFDNINPYKDVDVFHPTNVGLLVQNRPRFKPCTPHGIQVMLERSGIDTCGKQVAVINRSDIVGKPLSNILIQDQKDANATVTVCHDHTRPEMLKQITKEADIVIVAVGIPGFLTADMVRKGSVVIDVGITRVENKIFGDADFDNVSKKASAITPVPGGVGPMTVTMLLENTLKAAKLCTGYEL